MSRGCHNCKWGVGNYCERPGGSDCNWIGEMFHGQQNSWVHWEPKEMPAQKPKTMSEILRELADKLEATA